jgi:hypothetical protein
VGLRHSWLNIFVISPAPACRGTGAFPGFPAARRLHMTTCAAFVKESRILEGDPAYVIPTTGSSCCGVWAFYQGTASAVPQERNEHWASAPAMASRARNASRVYGDREKSAGASKAQLSVALFAARLKRLRKNKPFLRKRDKERTPKGQTIVLGLCTG